MTSVPHGQGSNTGRSPRGGRPDTRLPAQARRHNGR